MKLRENTAAVPTVEQPDNRLMEPTRSAPIPTRARRRGFGLAGGGTAGNERLTSHAGAVLIVLLAVLGVTILRIGQLMWMHLFVGLVLIGPLAVKMASTGYRFVRYYTGNPVYRSKGPPELLMRLTAPIVVASTAAVFASGIALMLVGPRNRNPLLLLHKASFIVWLCFTGLHVLGHLPAIIGSLRPAALRDELSGSPPGAAGRWISLAGALIAGVILAIALIPQFAPWTAHVGFLHDH